MRFLACLMLGWSLGALAKGTPPTLKLITYNVENLFDWTHDAGKEDYTFLPLETKKSDPSIQAYCASQPLAYQDECFNLDWSEKAVRQKIANLAQVLRESFVGGPDVAVIEEVENLHVLRILARAMGPKYRAVLIEGPDLRGVDVGMITRLPVLHKELQHVPMSGDYQTRGVLRVDVKTRMGRVSIIGNHWPSQANPDEDRLSAAHVLARMSKQALHRSHLVIAAGDFNTADDDVLNGIREVVLPMALDAEAEARAVTTPFPYGGTYNYKGVWGSLDHIFLMKSWHLRHQDWKKVRILNDGLVETRTFNGVEEIHPQGFDPATGMGHSDHLPLLMQVRI